MSEQSVKGWINLSLPSLGVFYKKPNSDEPAIPGGAVQIRRLTMGEIATLQSPGMDNLQRIAAIIAAACKIPNGFTADQLLLTDRQAILLYQRVITLGASYTFTYRCGACKSQTKWTTNILKDLVEVTPDELRPELDARGLTLQEPFDVKLPDEGVSVSCRFLRGKDESEIAKRAKRDKMQSLDQTDPSSIIRMALVIQSVNGEAWDTRRKEQMVRAMTAGDSLRLEYAVEERETGVDTTVYPVCTACGAEIPEGVALPFDREFFRPSAAALRDLTGSQVFSPIPRKGVHGTGD